MLQFLIAFAVNVKPAISAVRVVVVSTTASAPPVSALAFVTAVTPVNVSGNTVIVFASTFPLAPATFAVTFTSPLVVISASSSTSNSMSPEVLKIVPAGIVSVPVTVTAPVAVVAGSSCVMPILSHTALSSASVGVTSSGAMIFLIKQKPH